MENEPDPSKQAQEVILFHKIKKLNHPVSIFNNIQVNQKHLGMFLEGKLNICKHLKYITNKVNKTPGPLCKFRMILPRQSLVLLGFRIYQQNALLAITNAIRGTLRKNL